MHLHRQSIVPASPPGSAFGNLGSSQTLSSTQQRTGIESQCSIHEDKSLQGAVLAGRHGRTEEQVRCMHWRTQDAYMQDCKWLHCAEPCVVDQTCHAQAAISQSMVLSGAACLRR